MIPDAKQGVTSSADHAATVRDVRDALMEACWSPDDVAKFDELAALADRATELERERAGYVQLLESLTAEKDEWHKRAERAETAMRRIVSKDYDMWNPYHAVLQIARAALGETAPPEGSA